MNTNSIHTARITAKPVERSVSDWLENSLHRALGPVRAWQRRIERRRELRRLLETGHHLIVDTGMGVDEALHEISKPFYVA